MDTIRPDKLNQHKLLMPVLGISLFFLLYILAASLYPGGSNFDSISKGFSLLNNYWCDLMLNTAMNGDINPARPIAIAAWLILCFSISLFWFYLPQLFTSVNINHKIIQYSGILSTFIGLFIFTKYHDKIINAAAFFGAIALIAMFVELKEEKHYDLFRLGLFCFILGIINYIIFTTRILITMLPVIQKFTFVICLLTFGIIDFKVYQKAKQRVILSGKWFAKS